jgi:hypothetical protein
MLNKLKEIKELLEHIECKSISDVNKKEQAHNLLLELIEKVEEDSNENRR